LSRLQRILVAEKEGVALGQSIPSTRWPAIAEQCGADEVAEIRSRIQALRRELENVEEWDGDTQDDINHAIYFFDQLLVLCNGGMTNESKV
jgi:hypothetical protein